MRKKHDNEHVSNDGSTRLAYADKCDNLALTRDDDGVLVLRFHTASARALFTGQTHEDFSPALDQISLNRRI